MVDKKLKIEEKFIPISSNYFFKKKNYDRAAELGHQKAIQNSSKKNENYRLLNLSKNNYEQFNSKKIEFYYNLIHKNLKIDKYQTIRENYHKMKNIFKEFPSIINKKDEIEKIKNFYIDQIKNENDNFIKSFIELQIETIKFKLEGPKKLNFPEARSGGKYYKAFIQELEKDKYDVNNYLNNIKKKYMSSIYRYSYLNQFNFFENIEENKMKENYILGSNLRNSECLYRLGTFYEFGLFGFEYNLTRAIRVFKRSSKLGHLISKNKVKYYEELYK